MMHKYMSQTYNIRDLILVISIQICKKYKKKYNDNVKETRKHKYIDNLIRFHRLTLNGTKF